MQSVEVPRTEALECLPLTNSMTIIFSSEETFSNLFLTLSATSLFFIRKTFTPPEPPSRLTTQGYPTESQTSGISSATEIISCFGTEIPYF